MFFHILEFSKALKDSDYAVLQFGAVLEIKDVIETLEDPETGRLELKTGTPCNKCIYSISEC